MNSFSHGSEEPVPETVKPVLAQTDEEMGEDRLDEAEMDVDEIDTNEELSYESHRSPSHEHLDELQHNVFVEPWLTAGCTSKGCCARNRRPQHVSQRCAHGGRWESSSPSSDPTSISSSPCGTHPGLWRPSC